MHTQRQVCIVGGAGFIGSKITEALLARGDCVLVIDLVPSKISHPNLRSIQFDCSSAVLPPHQLSGIDAIINLAGVNIGKRWNRAYKNAIYKSRIDTTRSIVRTVSEMNTVPEVFIQASASGYYGSRGNMLLVESDAPGSDFLSRVCVDWEREAQAVTKFSVRLVVIRTANVLGPGGLLAKLAPIFRRGLGGYFGTGSQYMPWVHWRDIVSVYIHAIDTKLSGAYNISAGAEGVTQKELFTAFRLSVGSHFLWRIPFFIAWIIFGEFAHVLISSQRISGARLRESGYTYKVDTLAGAFTDSNN